MVISLMILIVKHRVVVFFPFLVQMCHKGGNLGEGDSKLQPIVYRPSILTIRLKLYRLTIKFVTVLCLELTGHVTILV